MSVLINKHRIPTYPIELLDHISRSFNSVVRSAILDLRATSIDVKFKKFENSSQEMIVHLFAKLAKAFSSIKTKYLSQKNISTHIKLKILETETHYVIKIIGVHKIPPGKILNLLGLILWSYIKYISGVKPAMSIWGRELTEAWKTEEKYLRKELSKSPNRLIPMIDPMVCHICAQPAYFINEWQFYYPKERRYIPIKTVVCEKHKREVL